MNNTRRKQIKDIISNLENIQQLIDDVCAEEQDSYDNIPENLQDSLRASDSEEAIDYLESASDNVSEAIDNLESIC